MKLTKRQLNTLGTALWWGGLFTVLATHIWMLTMDASMTNAERFAHSWVNLFAVIALFTSKMISSR